jgi:hypothetical protein
MTDYDFRQLNDKEFEILATDLLSGRDGARYERFKPGKDGGVDGRYFKPDGKEVVLQCKHWSATPLERLVRHLEIVELPKLKKLKPSRYILVLSHALSRTDKASIAKLLTPFVQTQSDVLGREDLNDLLSKNKEVELRHYKLWISSTTVLQHLLNKPIQDRSSFALNEILEDAHLYVPTANHDRALEKLDKLGTVIITGPAGIGKTTLADHLALNYVARGYTFIRIAEEIREAEAVYESTEQQLFYFDDFLGRNYLEALSGHEGTHIVQFIKRIVRDKKKRFILTSRTTILNQGKLLIDVLQTNNLERNEFEISIGSFSEMDRARILYNHLWHSSLEPAFVDELYAGKRYRQIISHRNYNPRLIRYITDSDRLGECIPSDYWPYAKELLDNPAKVWENPFDAQHDDFGRALVMLVTLNGRPIEQSELAESYSRFIAHPDTNAMNGRRDFLQNLRHLSGSLLSRTLIDNHDSHLNLFNPSIGDFVLHRYSEDLPSLRAGFCSLRSIASLRTLLNLEANELMASAVRASIVMHILQTASANEFVGYSSDYVALALLRSTDSFAELSAANPTVATAARFVVLSDCPRQFGDVASAFQWCLANSLVTQDEVANFIGEALELSPESTELGKLAELISYLGEDRAQDLWPALEVAVVAYFTDAVYDEFPDEDVFRSVDFGNTSDAERNLSRMVEYKLDALGIPITDSAVEIVMDAFDVSGRMYDFFCTKDDYDDIEHRTFSGPQADAIDDLFDRTR